MMQIYFAAPLFNQMELDRNETECKKLEDAGFGVFLPQRDAGKNADIPAGPEAESNQEARGQIFKGDLEAMLNADICVAYIDGRTQDEGTCWEMGWMHGRGKPIFIVCTDVRYFAHNAQFNIMIEYGAREIFKTTEDLIIYLKDRPELANPFYS